MILAHTGTFSIGTTFSRDWMGLQQWLTSPLCTGNLNRQGLILDGTEIARMPYVLYPQILASELGASLACNFYSDYSDAGCPPGEPENDGQYCVRLEPAAGAPFGGVIPVDVFGNSICPNTYPAYTVLGTAGTGVGNRIFEKVGSGTQAQYAQVVNDRSGATENYRTVLNGYASHLVAARDPGHAGDPDLECPSDPASILAGANESIEEALKWVLSPLDPRTLGLCAVTCDAAGVPAEDGGVGALVDRLYPARPNPLNPRTTIRFSLAAAGDAKLVVYDVTGRTVRTLVDGPQTAGLHEVIWDGQDDGGHLVPSGVYWTRLSTASFQSNRKMIVLK